MKVKLNPKPLSSCGNFPAKRASCRGGIEQNGGRQERQFCADGGRRLGCTTRVWCHWLSWPKSAAMRSSAFGLFFLVIASRSYSGSSGNNFRNGFKDGGKLSTIVLVVEMTERTVQAWNKNKKNITKKSIHNNSFYLKVIYMISTVCTGSLL